MSTAEGPRDEPAGDATAELERLVEQFEDAWRAGQRPAIEDYLPADSARRPAVLRELVHTDLEYRLAAGDPVRIEEYLQRYPELAQDRAVVADLIATEIRLRRQAPGPTLKEYLRRFPQYRQEAAALLPALPSVPEPGQPRPPGLASPPAATSSRGPDGTEDDSPSRDGRSGQPQEEAIPQEIGHLGRFTLLAKLGAGACGTVYRAWDGTLQRTVALKVLPGGEQADPAAVERLLREARTAADLRHPGIAALHEAGMLDGLAYLVSEYVPGQTLAARLRAGPVGFREAASWLAQVAEALHYAHEHGVVHRDIKSSNIQLDPEGNPHLLDFGLAKWEGAGSTLTQEGQPLGTPAYMSPEQARGEAHRVDRRSDVYSLGAVLYELLTGQLPFRGNRSMVLAQVLDEEPQAPRRLNDAIPRDLETICLKALAKEPAGRYPTTAALAEDLRRFLAGRPVQARPLGAPGRLWRWCRRNPVPAGLVTTLVLVTVLGFAGVTWQWRQAARHLAESERQRFRAEQSYHRIRRAWNDLIALYENNLRPELPEPFRRELRDRAVKQCQDIIEECGDDPALRRDLARAYFLLGALYQDFDENGSLEQKSLGAYRKALSIWDQFVGADPTSFECRSEWARTLCYLARLELRIGQMVEGSGHLRQARDAYTGLVRAEPGDPDLHFALAGCALQLGTWYHQTLQPAEARACAEEAHVQLDRLAQEKARPGHFREALADNYTTLAVLQRQLGQPRQALRSQQQALELLEGLVSEGPASITLRRNLARSYGSLGWLQQDNGQVADALRSHHKAHALLEELVRENPGVRFFRVMLAQQLYHLARAQKAAGQADEALRLYQQAAGIWERVVAEVPLVQNYQRDLAAAYHNLGTLHTDRGEPSQALRCYEQALRIREKLSGTSPENLLYRRDLGGTQHALGKILASLGRREEALAAYQRAVEHQRAVVARAAESPEDRRCLRKRWLDLALLQHETGHRVEAAASFREYLKLGRGDPSERDNAAAEFARCVLAATKHQPASPP